MTRNVVKKGDKVMPPRIFIHRLQIFNNIIFNDSYFYSIGKALLIGYPEISHSRIYIFYIKLITHNQVHN